MDRFLHGPLPEGYSVGFVQSIYNREAHRMLQSNVGWHSFYWVNDPEKKAWASLHVHVHHQEARSPFRAPFGSFEFSDEADQPRLEAFVDFIHEQLNSMGVKILSIKNHGHLITEKDMLEKVLEKKGYKIEKSETGAWLLVTSNFAGRLEPEKRRKLRHQREQALISHQLTLDALPSVYDFIARCRSAKGYSLSLSRQEMEALSKTFPNDVLLFESNLGTKRIAAAICIRVNEHTLYVFYYDHLAEYNFMTPVISLMEAIHTYCGRHSFSQIDLGTSMLDDQVNEGLLNFKLSLGALPVIKNTWRKSWV